MNWNVPKWSETSVMITPDVICFAVSFVYMWSINVADELAILVGIVIVGRKPWLKIFSR